MIPAPSDRKHVLVPDSRIEAVVSHGKDGHSAKVQEHQEQETDNKPKDQTEKE